MSRTTSAAVASLLGVALVLRLYQLGHEDFWIDEIFQTWVSEQPLDQIIANYRPGTPGLTRDQAPLSHLLFHFVAGGPGNEAWARLPSAVFGTLAVGATLAVAVRLLPWNVALLGAALLALSPLDLWYSQEFRFYALWKLEAILSYLALLAALRAGGARWWVAYCAATVASLYTCILHAFVIAAQGVTVLWHGLQAGRARATMSAFVVALLGVALATSPVASVVLGELDRSGGGTRPVVMSALPYTLFAYAVGFSLGPSVRALHALPSPLAVVTEYPSVLLAFAVFVPITLAGARRLGVRSAAARVVLPWAVVPPVAVFLLGFVSNISYNVRYSLASLPAYVLVVAVGSLSLATRPRRRAALVAVLACVGVSLGQYYWDESYDKAQVRRALEHVEAIGRGTNRVVVVGEIARAFLYYAPAANAVVLASCDDSRAAEPCRGGARATPETLWVAAGRDWEGRAARCLARLSPPCNEREHRAFVGVDLWRLE